MSKSIHMKQTLIYCLFTLISIGLKAQIQVNISTVLPTCYGDANGEAIASASGGTAPYTYVWSDGQKGNKATGLKAGYYSVKVTDAAAQTMTKEVRVTQLDPVMAIVSSNLDRCCSEGTTPTFKGSAIGGKAPYTFTWRNLDNGQVTVGANLVNPSIGAYRLEVKDVYGCKADKTTSFNGIVKVELKTTDVRCGGGSDGSIEAQATGGAAPYKYKWSYQNKTTASISSLGLGIYSVTVTDANGCQVVESAKVREPEIIKLTTSFAHMPCAGSSAAFASVDETTGGKAPYTYKWSNGQNSAKISNLKGGEYTVTVTDAVGCSVNEKLKITEGGVLSLLIDKKNASCAGKNNGTAIATASGVSGGFMYKWSNGETGARISNLEGGTYKVTATNAAGCSAEKEVVIGHSKNLVINTTSADGAASVTSVEGGTAPFTYKWSNDQLTQSVRGLPTGTYSVTVTDAEGCQVVKTGLFVKADPGLTVDLSKTNASCNGVSNGRVRAVISGKRPPFTYRWSNDATTTGLDNVPAGTYSVTVTDADGVRGTSQITVNNSRNPSLNLASTNAGCSANTGTATVTDVVDGLGPFTYKWSNGQTGQTAINLASGSYTVTVTDAGGCTAVKTITVGSATGFTATTTTTNTNFNQSTGSATVSGINGGTPPYTYKWSDGQTTQTATNLKEGTYSVTVTDANGCQVVLTNIVVSSDPGVSVELTKTDASCNGVSNGSVKSVVTGKNPPFTYRWSNGATTADLNNVPSGTYSVTVTDANGLTSTAQTTVNNSRNFSVTLASTNAGCTTNTGTASVVDISQGVGPFTYKWSNGQTDPTANNLATGTYTVTVTDAAGCTSVKSTIVSAPTTSLTASVTTTNSSATGSTGTATVTGVTGGRPPYTYKWSDGQTTQTATNLKEGTYSVTVTDANGCQVVVTGIVVNVDPGVAVILTKTDASCNGVSNGSVKSTVTGKNPPFTYRWSNGATTPDLANVPEGTYILTVTDAMGLTSTAQSTLNNSRNLTLTTGSSNTDCNVKNGTSFVTNVIDGVGPYTYRWSDGQTTQTASNLGAGSYSVTVTDSQGCSVVASNIAVRDNASSIVSTPTVTDETCAGKNGKVVFNTTGGTAPYTYQWSGGTNTDNLAAGTYIYTVTDAKGCQTVVNNVVVRNSGSAISVNATRTDASCSGITNGTATATATGTGPFTYNWSNGSTSSTISNLAAGTYKVTVTNAAGCTAQTEVVVGTVKNLSATTVSANTNFNATTGTATVTSVTGGTPPYTYRWSNGQTGQTANNLAEGTYSVTVTDAEGCQVVVTNVVVRSNPNIAVSLTKTDASCSGVSNGSVTATPVGTAPFTYRWSHGPTTKDLVNVPSGTYTVTVTDATGLTATSQVTVNNSRVLTIVTGSTNAECSSNSGTTTVSSIGNGVAPYTYRWSNNQTTQTANNLAAGTYSVTVTDAQGCTISASNIAVGANTPTFVTTVAITDDICSRKTGKVAFTTSGGTAPYTYRWSGGTNTDNLAGGNYVFTITDAKGCTKIENVTIQDKGGVKAGISSEPIYNSSDPNFCTYDTVSTRLINTTTGATTGATYRWTYPTNRTSAEANPTVKLGSGLNTVQLKVTSAEGCSDSIRVNIDTKSPVIKVDVQDTSVTCQGVPAVVLAKNNNGSFPVTYRWTPDSLISANNGTLTPSVLVKGSGYNKVYVMMINSVGCSRMDSIVLYTLPVDAVKLSDISFKQDCNTRAISFVNKSPFADKVSWIFGDPSNPTAGSNAINPTYTYSQNGTFKVQIVPKVGCLFPLEITVPVRPPVSVVANRDTAVCTATPFVLRANTTTPNAKYEWSTNPNFTPVISTAATYNVTPTNTTIPYYVRVTDTAGCFAIDTVVVGNRVLRLTVDTLVNACVSLDKKVTILNGVVGDTLRVVWTPTSAIVGTSTGPEVTIKTATDITLNAQVRNQFGCTQTVNIPVKVRQVDALAKVDVNLIYTDDKINLSADPTGTGYTYQWTPTTPDVVNTKNATTQASPKQDTKFVVEVTDQYGCKDTASVIVTVLTAQCTEPYIFVPRAFSPNNDQLNDKVFVRGDYLMEEGFEFAIYNRWGERVFFTNNREVGWDGTSGSKGVCPDVYGYYVKGKCRKGETYFKKGNITVMK
jgi:gliding motility-associated-like protein